MAGKKRDRQKAQRQARRAQELARARARARRRKATRLGLLALAMVALAVFVSTRDGDDESVEETAASTTVPSATAAESKPCVPVSDPLPAGAPNVPIKEGPALTALVKEDLKEGTGAIVGRSDTVTVNYIGVVCSTGKIFDSSYSRDQPATFPLSGVIKGWTDGIPGMKVGGQRLLGIPPDQAYGAAGRPPTIGPSETLWFVVEVLETKPS